jgi:hypothetical protein
MYVCMNVVCECLWHICMCVCVFVCTPYTRAYSCINIKGIHRSYDSQHVCMYAYVCIYNTHTYTHKHTHKTGESKQVTTTTSSSKLARQSASTTSSHTVTLTGQTLSVSIPALASKRFGTEQVSATDQLTSFVGLNQLLPALPGIEPLSLGITVSVSKGTSKRPLDVAGLPISEAVKFTVPLTKTPTPPAPGKQLKCEFCC